MARLFDDASTQYAGITSSLGSLNDPLTMACWFNSDDATIAQVLMALSNTGATTGAYLLRALGNTAGDPVAATKQNDAGTTQGVSTTTGYSVNTWHHACGVFTSDTARTAYIDGGSSATVSTPSISDPTADAFNIGAWQDSAGYKQYMSGMIAHAAIWNAALTAAEVASLAKGMDPRQIRPESLIAYWPLVGKAAPEIDIVGGYGLTLSTSAPTAAAHPRVFLPKRKLWTPPSSGVTGTLAVTTANDTLSAAGTTTVVGTLAKTTANDTLAASGTTTVTGTLAVTTADDTLAASGAVGSDVTGTLAVTTANDTLSAAGTTTVVGTVAVTEAADTLSASGWAGTVTGTLAVTTANDTLSAAGTGPASATVDGGGKWVPQRGNSYHLGEEPLRKRREKKPSEPQRVAVEEKAAYSSPSDLARISEEAVRLTQQALDLNARDAEIAVLMGQAQRALEAQEALEAQMALREQEDILILMLAA